MEGTPWNGLFYQFVLAAIVLTGATVMALATEDFLTRALAWGVALLCGVAIVRSVRRALRTGDAEHPTGRWWFGG